MSPVIKMKTSLKLIAALAVLALAVVPFLSIEDSDAAVTRNAQTETFGFDDTGSGTLRYFLKNDSTDEFTVTLKVTNFNTPDDVYAEKKVTVPGTGSPEGGVISVDIHFGYGSSGTKWVDVLAFDEAGNKIDAACENSVEINVSHSIWKNSATYIVIVVVIIVIVVAILLYIRSTKKTKADTTMTDRTFTRMHEERVARRAPAKAAKKKDYQSSGNRTRK